MIIGVDLRHLARGPMTGVGAVTEPLLQQLVLSAPEDSFRFFYNGRKPRPALLQVFRERFPHVATNVSRVPNRIFDVCLKVARRPYLDDRIGGADVFFSFNALLTPLRKAPRVLILHDLSFATHPEWYSPASRRWHRLMNIRKQVEQVAAIVVPSQATAFDLRRLWHIPGTKIHIIPWGAPEGIVAVKHPVLPRRILFIGTIEHRKNIRGLLDAFAIAKEDPQFSDVKLFLVGADGWGSDETKKEKRKMKNGDSVEFLGYIDEQQKRELLASASLFVYPSFYEGFGLPVLEAMAAGIPVIASNRTSLPEVAGNAAILVDPYRSEDIARAMGEVLSDDSLAREFSQRGRERAKQFTWKKTAESLLAVIREIAVPREK